MNYKSKWASNKMYTKDGRLKKWHRIKNQCYFIMIFVFVLCAMFLVSASVQYKKNERYREKISELQAQLQYENDLAEDLESRRKYMRTKQYIEEEARSKCGLVMDNEIIFKPEK